MLSLKKRIPIAFAIIISELESCYKIVPKKETIFHIFTNLIGNIKEYNVEKI